MALQWVQRSSQSFSPAGPDGKPVTIQTLECIDDSGAVIATFQENAFQRATFRANNDIRIARAKYDFAVDGGAISTITPANSETLPANAIIVGGTVNVTTAVLSAGSATVAVGTSAGSSTTSLLAATAKATLSINAILNAVPVFATPVKMSAAGTITFTIGTATLTAGVIEVFVFYVVAAA
jgi:hypothetical protein